MKYEILKYLERVGISISILINVVLGGPSNQTFSARNYKWQQDGKWNIVWLIDFIIFWDHDHCLNSWLYYKTTRNLRKSYYKKSNKLDLPHNIYYSDFIE